MMAIHILATGIARAQDAEPLKSQGDFRKATRNMMLAWLALQEAIAELSDENRRHSALVLGSGFGELEVTKNFLKGLAASGVARPILFQNSLHNSTLGFLALKLAFTGPTITVSNRCFTGESCLETAAQLLDLGQARFCAVIGVDTLVPDLGEALAQIYGAPVTLGEGATTLLLANDTGLRAWARPALATLGDIHCESRASSRISAPTGYYEADALERLARELRAATGSTGSARSMRLEKPDGTYSVLEWSIS